MTLDNVDITFIHHLYNNDINTYINIDFPLNPLGFFRRQAPNRLPVTPHAARHGAVTPVTERWSCYGIGVFGQHLSPLDRNRQGPGPDFWPLLFFLKPCVYVNVYIYIIYIYV